MKKNYKRSSDKTEDSDWNNFCPAQWQKFKEELLVTEFVDRTDAEYWENSNDTVVFILNLKTKFGDIDPIGIVNSVRSVYCDEFDYVKIGEGKYIIWMWWD